jgi:hypothetical protein
MLNSLHNRSFHLLVNFPASDAAENAILSLKALLKAAITAISSAPEAESILGRVTGFNIIGKLSDGSDRGALVIGNTPAVQSRYVAEGEDYYPPTMFDINWCYIISAGSAIENVSIELYIC